MKNILNKIYFHPIFLICVFIFIMLGNFKLILYFMLIIFIHELGHILASLIFNWRIEKIIVLPFGCYIKFNEIINRPLIEEFLVSISGVLFQFTFYILLNNIVDYKYFTIINYFIILFNLIPIYPLDGSKLLNFIFNKMTNYKSSILLTVIFSYIFLIILMSITFRINKLIVITLLFLLLETNKLHKNKEFLFNKFLLERHLYDFKFRKKKNINSIDKMKKDYKHLFYINGKYLTEKYFLEKIFDNNNIL